MLKVEKSLEIYSLFDELWKIRMNKLKWLKLNYRKVNN